MKHILIILAGIIICSSAFGQTVTLIKNEKIVKQIERDLTDACDKNAKSWVVHDLPSYKGGETELMKDINQLVKLDSNLSGTFDVHFLINCKGKASGFLITDGINDNLDENIIKSLAKLQNWKPGKYKNENVDCTYTLKFIIEKGTIKTVF